MKQRGLSQDKLAEMITARGRKVTGANISIIERSYDKTKAGTPTQPHRRFVELAAEILGDDVDEALNDAGHSPRNGGTDDGLWSGYKNLPPEKQKLARKHIKAIIDSLADDDDE